MDLDDFITPIWENTYWVYQALGVYEAIADKADLINNDTVQAHFWGVTQQFALTQIAVDLYKIFDPTRSGDKHCVLKAFSLLKQKIHKEGLPNLEFETLRKVGFSQADAERVIQRERDERSSVDAVFLDVLQSKIPNDKTPGFKKLKNFRNIKAAHQKVLSAEDSKNLPSLEKMQSINSWAEGFCQLVAECCGKRTLINHGIPSGKRITLNVIQKALDLNFDLSDEGRKMLKDFYKLPA